MACLNNQPDRAFKGLDEEGGLAHGEPSAHAGAGHQGARRHLPFIASAVAALLALACLAATIAIGVDNRKQRHQIRDLKTALRQSNTVASSSSGASLLRSTSTSSPPSSGDGAMLTDDPNAVVPGYTFGGPLFAGSGYWIRAKDMIYQRSDHEVQAIKNNIYILGGLSNTTSSKTVLNAVTAYDVVSGEMTPKAPMPTPRCRFAAAHYDGKVYVMTGYAVPDDAPKATKLTTLHIYDIATNKWAVGKPSKRARSDACAAAVGGKIYLVGGWDNDWALVDVVEVFDPATGAWSDGPKMRTPRGDCKCANLDGQLYVVGGYGETNFSAATEAWDPAARAWVAKADLGAPRGDLAMVVLGGKLLAIGGEQGDAEAKVAHEVAMNSVEEYHPKHDIWVPKGPLPEARFRFAGTVCQGQVYVMGGHPTCNSASNQASESCTHNGLRSVYTFVDVVHPDVFVLVKSQS